MLVFSKYRSFASLNRFIPKYFIHFDMMINGIVSLISLFDSSLLVCRSVTDFCLLFLFPATLSDSLMSFSSFQLVSLGFSMYNNRSSVNNGHFTSFFPIWAYFTYFYFLIAVARTSKTVLIKIDESEHSCLVPDPRGDTFRLLLLRS